MKVSPTTQPTRAPGGAANAITSDAQIHTGASNRNGQRRYAMNVRIRNAMMWVT